MTTASDWARTVVARLAVGDADLVSSGDLDLAPFQRAAARRLTRMVSTWGGALLADAVGLGKTRVCLTVAATVAREQRIAGARGTIWCCVPARLIDQWRAAAAAAGIHDDAIEFVSHTQMSRGRTPDTQPLMIIVDEAHRFRNPNTRRRHTLIERADAPILLATATPVANSTWDLYRLLDLFVDDADVRRLFGWDLRTAFELAEARKWDVTELVREVTVRRLAPPDSEGFGRRPGTRLHVETYVPSADESWIWQNLESELARLSLAATGGDWPRGLFVEHVLRRWESGPEALLETVSGLIAFHERWLEAWQCGGSLDRRTFRTLFGDDVARQQVFGFVYPAADGDRDDSPVRRDLDRLRQLEGRVREVVHAGSGRDDVVLRLARASDQRLLVFTSYRRAARALFDRLRTELGPTARVGLLTGDEARATGLGRVSPTEIIRRFAPRSNRVASPRRHHRLRLLVATDCIAEGMNLQDCGRVVLADLPYTPLGIEQRVGRLLRPGGPHEVVDVYLPRPRDWSDSLGMRRRLQEKLTAAHSAGVGSNRDWFGAAHDGENPLAALTALDRLATQFDNPDADLPRCIKLVDAPRAWIVIARIEGDDLRDWWFRVEEERPVHDMRAIVADLAELVWDDRPLRPVADLPAEIQAIVEQRQRFLISARHAPAALTLDDPATVAWRMLCAAREELKITDLEDVRDRLLRRHSAGVRRRLGQFTERTSNVAALLRYARTLAPAGSTDVRVRVVSALGIR